MVSLEKKIPAQAVREKKKFVPAENPPPSPPHYFSNGPSLNLESVNCSSWKYLSLEELSLKAGTE